jgi:hypothetical protein
MKTVVFFLEEPSAKEMLEGLLPRITIKGDTLLDSSLYPHSSFKVHLLN